MTPRQRFGRYLATARRKADLAQADVAREMGWGAQYVSNIERGVSLPPARTLPVFVKLLGLSKIEIKAKLSALVTAEADERYAKLVKHLEGR